MSNVHFDRGRYVPDFLAREAANNHLAFMKKFWNTETLRHKDMEKIYY